MSNTTYRADHCGSLIRPERLRQARSAYVHRRISHEELMEVKDTAICEVLALQKEVGLDIYSDGEYRRGFWLSAISDEFFEGMENEGIDYIRYPFLKGKAIAEAELLVPPNPIVKGKLRRQKRITGDEIAFLSQNTPGPFKITIPSPVTLSRAQYKSGVSEKAYPTWTEFFDDYTRLIAEEIGDIVRDGVKYVQLDAPHYTRFMVPERRIQLTSLGINLKDELDAAIAAENRCLHAAEAEGITTAVHICLGTYILGAQGPLGGAGDYDVEITARLIDDLDADVSLIEYSDRVSTLESLRGVGKDKTISLGILNVRDPRVRNGRRGSS